MMKRQVQMEEAPMLSMHREFMGNLEKSFNLVAQDIGEQGKMAFAGTDAFCHATARVLDELAKLIDSISAPRWLPREDSRKISELSHRIHGLYDRYKAVKK